MNITQDMYDVVKQPIRNLYARLEVLDFDFNVVDEISGDVIGQPSFTQDANSDIRRTVSIDIIVSDKDKYKIEAGNRIWLDKYLRIYAGIENMRDGEVVWSKMGTYLINNPNSKLNATEHTISFQGVDLMAKLTGMRNGNLEGIAYEIPQDSDIRGVVIDLLKRSGFNDYVIELRENEVKTYREIKVDGGGTVFNLLSELRDMYVNYEMYFDEDGVFVFKPIPTGENEPIIVDDDLWETLLLDVSVDTSFDGVKNSIIVLGKPHDVSYYSEPTTVSGDTYNLSIADLINLENDTLIGFTAPSVVSNPKIKVNSFTTYPLLDFDGNPAVIPEKDEYYVIRFKDNKFDFLGYLQPKGTAKDNNPNSPFYIGDNGEFEIREVLSGGDYDNIFSNDLARMRADFELYHKSRLNDKISITCVPIYWLNVHKIISLNINGDMTQKYLIQSINTTFGESGTQSISATVYYPFYEIL